MEKTYRRPRFGEEKDNHSQTDLELNLAMMEAMGGVEIHGDKPVTDITDDEILDEALELVDNPDRLGRAN